MCLKGKHQTVWNTNRGLELRLRHFFPLSTNISHVFFKRLRYQGGRSLRLAASCQWMEPRWRWAGVRKVGQRRREAATLPQGGAGVGWVEHLPEEAPWRPGKAYLTGEKHFEGKQTFSRRQLRKTNTIVADKKQLLCSKCHTLCARCILALTEARLWR